MEKPHRILTFLTKYYLYFGFLNCFSRAEWGVKHGNTELCKSEKWRCIFAHGGMPSLQRQRWTHGAGAPIPNAGLEKPEHLNPGSSTSSGIPETTAFHLWRTHSWEVSQSCQFGFPSEEGKDTLGIFTAGIYVSAPPLHFHEPKLQEFISLMWPLMPSRTTMK